MNFILFYALLNFNLSFYPKEKDYTGYLDADIHNFKTQHPGSNKEDEFFPYKVDFILPVETTTALDGQFYSINSVGVKVDNKKIKTLYLLCSYSEEILSLLKKKYGMYKMGLSWGKTTDKPQLMNWYPASLHIALFVNRNGLNLNNSYNDNMIISIEKDE